MFIIYLFSDIILILLIVLVFTAGTFAITLRFLTLRLRHYVFRLWFHAWNLLYIKSSQKQVTNVSLSGKDSDMESENLSSLIGFLYQMARKHTVQKLYFL